MNILRSYLLLAFLIFTGTDAVAGFTDIARSYIKRIRNSSGALVQFDNEVDSTRNDTVYLFIQGIELGNGEEWVPALDLAIQKKVRFYFHKIYKRKSLKRNVALIKKTIAQVEQRHPNKHIDIMAYSAGGAATLVAWRDLESTRAHSNLIRLTSVASPVSGYGSPKLAVPFVSLFAGAYIGTLGQGLKKELNGQHLTQCRHFVNMDCSLDKHSCPHPGTKNTELLPEMPCGSDNITEFHRETHESIVRRAAEIIIE